MWPWEHLAVGYLCYSLWVHWRHDRPPTGAAVVAVVVATQLPDLVDKPLAWWLGVLPSGRSLGHSLFFAAPVTTFVWLIFGRRIGGAFAIGYVSHLITDVVHPAILGGSFDYTFLVWPLIERPQTGGDGLLVQTQRILSNFGELVTSPEGVSYLLFTVVLLGTAALLWAHDGFPGLHPSSYRRDERGRDGTVRN